MNYRAEADRIVAWGKFPDRIAVSSDDLHMVAPWVKDGRLTLYAPNGEEVVYLITDTYYEKKDAWLVVREVSMKEFIE